MNYSTGVFVQMFICAGSAISAYINYNIGSYGMAMFNMLAVGITAALAFALATENKR